MKTLETNEISLKNQGGTYKVTHISFTYCPSVPNLISNEFRETGHLLNGIICPTTFIFRGKFIRITPLIWRARWPSGRVSDSAARGQGSIPTSAMLCP